MKNNSIKYSINNINKKNIENIENQIEKKFEMKKIVNNN